LPILHLFDFHWIALRQYNVFGQAQGFCGRYRRYPARIKLLADDGLSVVSETTEPHPFNRARFQGAHQAQLEPVSEMLSQHTNAAEIAGVANMG
jgi:hypothetical protein